MSKLITENLTISVWIGERKDTALPSPAYKRANLWLARLDSTKWCNIKSGYNVVKNVTSCHGNSRRFASMTGCLFFLAARCAKKDQLIWAAQLRRILLTLCFFSSAALVWDDFFPVADYSIRCILSEWFFFKLSVEIPSSFTKINKI